MGCDERDAWLSRTGCNSGEYSYPQCTGIERLIARLGFQGVFAHSRDKTFDKEGQQSRFPYAKAFSFYKQYFLQALISGGRQQEKMLALFAWHNGHIFPPSIGRAAGPSSGAGSAGEELSAALDALEVSSDELDAGIGQSWVASVGTSGNGNDGRAGGGWGRGAATVTPADMIWDDGPGHGGSANGGDDDDDKPIPMYEGEGTQIVPGVHDVYDSDADEDGVGVGKEAAAGGVGEDEIAAAAGGDVEDETVASGFNATTPIPAPPARAKKAAPAKGKGKRKVAAPPPATPMRRGRSAAGARAADV